MGVASGCGCKYIYIFHHGCKYIYIFHRTTAAAPPQYIIMRRYI